MQNLLLTYPYEVFTLMTVIGALYCWIEAACKGAASFNPIEYWLKETPGYTGATVTALIVSWWAVISGELLEGATWQVIVGMGALTGYFANNAFTRGPGGGDPGAVPRSISGFARFPALILAAVLSLGAVTVLGGCAGTPGVTSKAQSQALTYYTIGQAYEQIEAKWERKEITTETAKTLTLQVDFALRVLDITRQPSVKGVQDALAQTADELSRVTLGGVPLLTRQQYAQVQMVLALARETAPGNPLPSTQDTAGWLMLGSNVLRAVNSAIN